MTTAKKLADKVQTAVDIDGRLSQLPERNHRILVVEDEHGIAEAYKDILVPKAGNVYPIQRSSRVVGNGGAPAPATTKPAERFELTIVHNAEAAFAEVQRSIAQKKPFTMGFFDVLLGQGMDGIELVKRIHEIDSDIFAVFVTAYSDRNVDSIQSLLGEQNSNRWDYLNKPFTQGEILQKARSGVAIWNMRREKDIKDEHMASLQKHLLENERYATMATVSRGIGHEFRNILTSMIGKAELSENLKSIEQLRETLRGILGSAHRAAEILKRFDSLHKGGDHRLAKRWMFAHEPLEEAVAMLSHQIKTNNVRVCWIRKKSCLIYGNATALVQVYVNLLINAMHAMGTSGQIDLSVVEIAGKIEVKFRDYGPGVDKKIVEKVCEPFFTTKGENGTGLGLSISKEIIETDHDGKFTVANHEIKGLEITIHFPVKEEEAKPESNG